MVSTRKVTYSSESKEISPPIPRKRKQKSRELVNNSSSDIENESSLLEEKSCSNENEVLSSSGDESDISEPKVNKAINKSKCLKYDNVLLDGFKDAQSYLIKRDGRYTNFFKEKQYQIPYSEMNNETEKRTKKYIYEVCKSSYKKLSDTNVSVYGFSSYIINYASKNMLINIPLDARNLQATGTKYVASYDSDNSVEKKDRMKEASILRLNEIPAYQMLKFLKDPYSLLVEKDLITNFNLSEKLSDIFAKIRTGNSNDLSVLNILADKLSSQRVKIEIFNCPETFFPRFVKDKSSIVLVLTNSISITCVNEFQSVLNLISSRLMFKEDIEDHDSIKRVMDFFFYSLGIESKLVLKTKRCTYSAQSIALSKKLFS